MRQPGSMPTLEEIIQPQCNIERRMVGRTTINRDVLAHFAGQEGIHLGRAMSFLGA